MKWNFWCSDSVKSAEGVDSRRRAATARPHGPAPMMSTSWTEVASSNSVMVARVNLWLESLKVRQNGGHMKAGGYMNALSICTLMVIWTRLSQPCIVNRTTGSFSMNLDGYPHESKAGT